MTATMADEHTVLGAIGLANRAPSVHNTQPWRWLDLAQLMARTL
jgi:nitroreductase